MEALQPSVAAPCCASSSWETWSLMRQCRDWGRRPVGCATRLVSWRCMKTLGRRPRAWLPAQRKRMQPAGTVAVAAARGLVHVHMVAVAVVMAVEGREASQVPRPPCLAVSAAAGAGKLGGGARTCYVVAGSACSRPAAAAATAAAAPMREKHCRGMLCVLGTQRARQGAEALAQAWPALLPQPLRPDQPGRLAQLVRLAQLMLLPQPARPAQPASQAAQAHLDLRGLCPRSWRAAAAVGVGAPCCLGS